MSPETAPLSLALAPRRASNAPARRNCAIPEPGRDPGLPRALSRDEVQALLVAARTPRDRLLLETCYRTGARASEVAELRRVDIGAEALELANRKQRRPERRRKVVYLDDPAFCGRLLLWCQRQGIPDEGYVFPSRKGGGPLGKDQVRRIVQDAARRAGILLEKRGRLRPAWTHTLRHSAAVRWLEGSDGDVQFAAEQMGHASIRSMDAYRAIADTRRRKLARGCDF